MSKISIVIPSYNSAKYLKHNIKNILNQTYKNIEVILVNDGSTDNTDEVIKSFMKDDRFKYYKKTNGGVAVARNYGLSKATGDYILFMDSDDNVEKTMLEKMYNKLKETNADLVCCGFDRIDDKTKKVYSVEMTTMKYDELVINKKILLILHL